MLIYLVTCREQIHAVAALPSGKHPTLFGYQLRWHKVAVDTVTKRETSMLLSGTELLTSNSKLVTLLTDLGQQFFHSSNETSNFILN